MGGGAVEVAGSNSNVQRVSLFFSSNGAHLNQLNKLTTALGASITVTSPALWPKQCSSSNLARFSCLVGHEAKMVQPNVLSGQHNSEQ